MGRVLASSFSSRSVRTSNGGPEPEASKTEQEPEPASQRIQKLSNDVEFPGCEVDREEYENHREGVAGVHDAYCYYKRSAAQPFPSRTRDMTNSSPQSTL